MSLVTLLHAADQLQTLYKAAHGRAATYAKAIAAASQQQANLLRSPASPHLRDRTLARLQDSIEQALSGIRDELAKMENAVDQLRELALKVDVFLTSEGAQGRHHESLVQVRALFMPIIVSRLHLTLAQVGAFWEACRAELVDKREVSPLLLPVTVWHADAS